MTSDILFSFFLIFSGAAVLATVALYTRQPLILAYIVLGVCTGPYGMSWISDAKLLSEVAEIGIIFLLFLLGLDMQPKALWHVLRSATLVALISSVIFALIAFVITISFGFTLIESLIVAAACMFSSTIIGIKLLPTTVLHHRHTGELVVGLLLLQDLIAILVLLFLGGVENGVSIGVLSKTLLALPLLAGTAYLFVKYILLRLLAKFDLFHEYVFLLAIGWCLGFAEFSKAVGLSLEMGAFIAGVSIATSPIAQYIAESLKPLRDFFLVLFFFTLGAGFNVGLLEDVIVPAGILALTLLLVKPITFRFLLGFLKEHRRIGWEVGFRLGQISEFSLLIAFLATSQALIGEKASMLIQATAIIMFMVSSYIVVFNFTSPIAVSDKLRRN